MSTLRERSHVILWTLLFFFVASLVLGGLMSGSNILGVLFGSKDLQNYVGTIDENRITIREYEYQRSIELNRIASRNDDNYTLTEKDIINAGNSAWRTLIDDYIKNEKIKSLGLTTHGDEVREFFLISPPEAYKTNLLTAGLFKNEDETFNLQSYQDAMKNNTLPEGMKDLNALWEPYIKDWLSDRKLRDLYNTIKTVPEYEIMDTYLNDNIDVKIDYLFINPNNIPDSLVSISDDLLLEDYNKNKDEKYKIDENITVNYILYTTNAEPGDTIDYEFEKNELYNDAFQFSVEANEYTSFDEAMKIYEKNIKDTLTLTQDLSINQPVKREVVRFAFDNNIGNVSDPIEMEEGIAIFHIIAKNKESYKDFNDVKEQIESTLKRDIKKDKARVALSEAIDTYTDWSKLVESNDWISTLENQEGKISNSFSEVGTSSELQGALHVLENDQTSKIIETLSSLLIVKMVEKSIFNDDDYKEKYEGIKTNLLSRNADYFNWLNSRRNEIEVEDWRHLIY